MTFQFFSCCKFSRQFFIAAIIQVPTVIATVIQVTTADKAMEEGFELSLLQHNGHIMHRTVKTNLNLTELHNYSRMHDVKAALRRQSPEDAMLDGGGEPWVLFHDQIPQEQLSQIRSEVLVPADPNDPVGARCCPGDTQGYWYYNVSTPTLVPFILEKDHPGRVDAAVIIAPGGGNSFLAWNKEGTQIAKWLNSIGFSAFVLKYRVPCNTDETKMKSLIDAQRAVSLVRHRAPEFQLNASRIGFMGFSAGAGLTTRVSTIPARAYEWIDDVDGKSHKPDFQLVIYGTGDAASAHYAPPTFLAIATDDQCASAEEAELYYGALMMRANSHDELHVFAEGRHGYGDCTLYVEGGLWEDVCAWTANAEVFLKSQILNIHPPLSSEPTAPGVFFTRGQSLAQ